MEFAEIRQILQSSLARHLAWIAAADAKTGFVFAVCTAMLGLLAAAAPAYGKWTALGVILSSVAVSLIFASLAALLSAVFPRTSGPRFSLIFFGGVAARSIDEFRSEIRALDDEGYLEDLIQQCHINAQIAAAKYKWVRIATALLYVAVPVWLSAAYVLFRDK